MGATVVVSTRVSNLDREKAYTVGPVKLNIGNNQSLEVDLVINTIGNKVNPIKGLVLASEVTGFKVDANFRAEGYSNVFCVGDCADSKDGSKVVMAAQKHFDTAIKAIVAMEREKKVVPTKGYTPNKDTAAGLIPLGSENGVGIIPKLQWSLPTFLVVKIKSQDLMTGMLRSRMK